MSQTDEEMKENILAAVKGVSYGVPGKWFNVQKIALKVHKSISIPIYVNLSKLCFLFSFYFAMRAVNVHAGTLVFLEEFNISLLSLTSLLSELVV